VTVVVTVKLLLFVCTVFCSTNGLVGVHGLSHLFGGTGALYDGEKKISNFY
jgi:hypothetical protein